MEMGGLALGLNEEWSLSVFGYWCRMWCLEASELQSPVKVVSSGSQAWGQGVSLRLTSSLDSGDPALTSQVTLGGHRPLLGSFILFPWHPCSVPSWHE